ncbi:acyltransferase [Desulfuromonas sp. TF]|uniref:acyltransferase n=1 Tax=Desulfuromonas sp. TF TaxID=1232410 RepID=UPI0003F6C49B|nr:acyltransferase [Desulfuromonas sp. TF]
MKILQWLQRKFGEPAPDRFAREPWRYHREATELERQAQAAREAAWRAQGDCRFSEDVYVSPGATVNPRHLVVGARTAVGSETQIGIDLEMGADCTVNAGAVVRGKVRIGDGVRIATGAQVVGFNHCTEDLSKPIYQQPLVSRGIFIGDDVWIGANAVIVDGVTIGSHAIIGAGAIVTRDIPPWTLAAGNPARVISSRMYGRPDKNRQETVEAWHRFGDKVAAEIPGILERSFIDNSFVDFPGDAAKTRPWADAIELATMTGTPMPGYSREQLINILQGFQDPDTGLVPGPYSEDQLSRGGAFVEKMECRHSAYMVMAVGYALECLGSSLKYPVKVAHDLTSADLISHLDTLPWHKHTWSSGAWIDHFASACYFNARYHSLHRDMDDLKSWLRQNVDPGSGMWGTPHQAEDWSQPVNGFYRLTRGAHAQWGWELPFPRQAIDTVLAHAHDQRYFAEGQATACMVLDIIHPLWLCLKQTDHRRPEIEAVAQYWLNDTISRWRSGEGMSFECRPEAVPRLQGTEMWVSIAWYCADILGIVSVKDEYKPKGVHRPETVFL